MGYNFDYGGMSGYVADTCMAQIKSYNTSDHLCTKEVGMGKKIAICIVLFVIWPPLGIAYLIWLAFFNKPSE